MMGYGHMALHVMYLACQPLCIPIYLVTSRVRSNDNVKLVISSYLPQGMSLAMNANLMTHQHICLDSYISTTVNVSMRHQSIIISGPILSDGII